MVRSIAVVGLGYVGLPVAVAFGKSMPVIGFDINPVRLRELQEGVDHTREVTTEELKQSRISYTDAREQLQCADFFIITVPTPIDSANRPDLTPLRRASETVGQVLKKGDIVVYESTVYPGATEEVCIPILEQKSGLKAGIDFAVGYSPERINPGDKKHTFTKIKKVVSAQTPEALEIIADVYASVVQAGVFKARSIKVAEAAKVIENTQRDINIALMNELALVFDRLDIDTLDVLEAAGTKWNFLPFRPGFVGGHCIGVDPYYLTYKAEQVGYDPQVILAGRRINNSMAAHVALRTVQEMVQNQLPISGSRVTVMGLTFKENCPDVRNSKVFDLITELKKFNLEVQVCDPWARSDDAQDTYDIDLCDIRELKPAHALIFAVAHQDFKDLTRDQVDQLCEPNAILVDVKGTLDRTLFESPTAGSGREYKKIWRL